MSRLLSRVTMKLPREKPKFSALQRKCSVPFCSFIVQDMNQFPEWVAQFLSGVNLYQPAMPQACRFALHLLRGKAAEMAKNIPQQVSMNNLQELLTGLDKLFNTTGNRVLL